jgi:hypothetical protein
MARYFWAALAPGTAASAQKTRNLKQSRYILFVVPAIALRLELCVDVGPYY